jgi:hypothetical protein
MHTATYALDDPVPFREVTDAISDALDRRKPEYIALEAEEQNYPTGDADDTYGITALEYAGVNRYVTPWVRGPHQMRFEVPREEAVDSFTVTHGITRGALYKRIVGDKAEIVDEIVDEVRADLGN